MLHGVITRRIVNAAGPINGIIHFHARFLEPLHVDQFVLANLLRKNVPYLTAIWVEFTAWIRRDFRVSNSTLAGGLTEEKTGGGCQNYSCHSVGEVTPHLYRFRINWVAASITF